MFLQLLSDLLQTLPETPAQKARVNRAVAECDGYTYEDRSAIFKEAACRVHTLSGGSYLVFPNQCGCEDWKQRCWGRYDEHGNQQACKHIIACEITGNFPLPVEEQDSYAEPFAQGGECAGVEPVPYSGPDVPTWALADEDEEEFTGCPDPSDEALCRVR